MVWRGRVIKWLESKIDETEESLGYSLDTKRYDGAFWYSVKNDVYKECLKEFERLKEKERDNGVSFDELEVGKKYISVFDCGKESGPFEVVTKGFDNGYGYVLHTTKTDSVLSILSENESCSTIEYFKEVE